MESPATTNLRGRHHGLMTVAYVSGPMTKADNHGYPLFLTVGDNLRQTPGVMVLNPAEGGPSEEQVLRHAEEHQQADFRETPMYAALMTRDIGFVLMSDVLFMLPQWEESRGAKAEHTVGTICGKRIEYITEDGDWAFLMENNGA